MGVYDYFCSCGIMYHVKYWFSRHVLFSSSLYLGVYVCIVAARECGLRSSE